MATLILSMDGLVLKEIILEKNRITIGRKHSNDIQIDNPVISGHHAVITTILNDSFLEDADSTNGTLVNGRQIKKYALKHNDVVEMGKYRLKYLNAPDQDDTGDRIAVEDSSLAGAKLSLEPTAASLPASSNPGGSGVSTHSGGANSGTSSPSGAGMAFSAAMRGTGGSSGQAVPGAKPAVLRVISGGLAGQALPLTKEQTTLGKPEVEVSRIIRMQEGYFITHECGPSPLVNGKKMQEFQELLLHENDIIEIQGVRMCFAPQS